MKKEFISLLISIALSLGWEGATFLIYRTPGARAIGMAQCFTAIADDATACYYNPAGLAFISHPQILSMNLSPPIGLAKATLWSLTELAHPLFSQKVHSPIDPPSVVYDDRYFYTAVVFPSVNAHNFGLDINYYKYSSMMEVNEIPTYTYYPCYALSLNYGRKFISNFGVGASIKYIYESLPYQIYNVGSTHAFAFGGGILFKSHIGFSFGASLSNLGPPIKYKYGETEAVLPLTARIGLAQSITEFFATISSNRNNFTQKLNHYFNFLFTIERKIDLAGEVRYHKTSCGFEIKAFDLLSYRQGFRLTKQESFLWDDPKSIGLDLKIAEFDITITNSNYYAGCWWIQSKFKPLDNKPEFLKRNETLDRIFLNLSCLAIPGGGQLYNGDKWQALPYLIASFFIADVILESHNKPSWQDQAYNTVVMTLPILYILSGVQANVALRRNEE